MRQSQSLTKPNNHRLFVNVLCGGCLALYMTANSTNLLSGAFQLPIALLAIITMAINEALTRNKIDIHARDPLMLACITTVAMLWFNFTLPNAFYRDSIGLSTLALAFDLTIYSIVVTCLVITAHSLWGRHKRTAPQKTTRHLAVLLVIAMTVTATNLLHSFQEIASRTPIPSRDMYNHIVIHRIMNHQDLSLLQLSYLLTAYQYHAVRDTDQHNLDAKIDAFLNRIVQSVSPLEAAYTDMAHPMKRSLFSNDNRTKALYSAVHIRHEVEKLLTPPRSEANHEKQ